MNTVKKIILLLTLISATSCAYNNYLRTQGTTPDGIEGTYTLILYGNRYLDDFENVAILDREGDPYAFEVISPAYNYTVINGVPAKEALDAAEKHVRSHSAAHRSLLKKIIGKDGSIVGYELTPFYSVSEFGYPDIIYTNYTIKDNKIRAWIRVRYEMDRRDNMLFKGKEK